MPKTILIVILFISTGIAGCGNPKTSLPIEGLSQYWVNNNSEFDYIKTLKNSDDLIRLLNSETPLESERVGFEGKSSWSYAVFQQLCKVADTKIFLQLTYHSNPKMRVYGMWALAKKNKTLALKLMINLKDDQETAEYISGCITMSEPVCALAAQQFDSSEVATSLKARNGHLRFVVRVKKKI